MKILNEHDYYDGAGWSIDPTCVFVRDSAASIPHALDCPIVLETPIFRLNELFTLTPGVIFVAGKRYPFVEERRTDPLFSPVHAMHSAYGDRDWMRLVCTFHYDPKIWKEKATKLFANTPKRSLANVLKKLVAPQRPTSEAELDWLIRTKTTTLVLRQWRKQETQS